MPDQRINLSELRNMAKRHNDRGLSARFVSLDPESTELADTLLALIEAVEALSSAEAVNPTHAGTKALERFDFT